MTPTIPAREDPGICPITPGLSLQWQQNGKILVFTWTDVSRETVDTFAQVYRAIIATWPIQESFDQLNDLRFEGFSFTPYLRSTVQQVIRESIRLGIKARVANLVRPGIIMSIVRFFLLATSLSPGVRAEIFTDFDSAMAWLSQS
jgi:hypothetical protein